MGRATWFRPKKLILTWLFTNNVKNVCPLVPPASLNKYDSLVHQTHSTQTQFPPLKSYHHYDIFIMTMCKWKCNSVKGTVMNLHRIISWICNLTVLVFSKHSHSLAYHSICYAITESILDLHSSGGHKWSCCSAAGNCWQLTGNQVVICFEGHHNNLKDDICLNM